MNRTFVSFDWAIKKLLRDKANFAILEGFLSELLLFQVKIQEILESESNQETESDKFDRVDILVRSAEGELMLIEVQYEPEDDYFQRMIYGISKLITQYISGGEVYGTIKKAYSINILYFGLGQGKDYLYEYQGEFIGMNEGDTFMPSKNQKGKYNIEKVSDIFPKYYLIRVNNFNKEEIEKPIDEWVYFLKKSEIKDDFHSKGMEEAKERLRYESMSDREKQAYNRFIENRRIEMGVMETAKYDALTSVAKNLKAMGISYEIIMQSTGLSMTEIEKI